MGSFSPPVFGGCMGLFRLEPKLIKFILPLPLTITGMPRQSQRSRAIHFPKSEPAD